MFQVSIRPYNKISDTDFIYSTWIKSYRTSGFARGISSPLYEMGQRSRIDRILSKETTYIYVATDKDTPELIFGYIVGEGDAILHYLYVKSHYRKQGIGKELLGEAKDLIYTHKSPDIWVEQKLKTDPTYSNWIYNPYLLDT